MEACIRDNINAIPIPVYGSVVDRYNVGDVIGKGSFGHVFNGTPTNLSCREVSQLTPSSLVAVKVAKKPQESIAECRKLREFIFISFVKPHNSLVHTYEMFLDSSIKKFNIIMETMEMSLIQLMDTRKKVPFTTASIQLMLYQIVAGLAHIHKSGFFHRDVKPENVLIAKVPVQSLHLLQMAQQYDSHHTQQLQLQQQSQQAGLFYQSSDPSSSTCSVNSISSTYPVSLASSSSSINSFQLPTPEDAANYAGETGSYIVKLADFGLARNTDCSDPFTSYVSTRWYRAPELLLRRGVYSCPIDIWAFGTMATEISTLSPLFPGSNEHDQLIRQLNILGYPGTKSHAGSWRSFSALIRKQKIAVKRTDPNPKVFENLLGHKNATLERVILSCLQWNPDSRRTADELLNDEFFEHCETATRILFASGSRFYHSNDCGFPPLSAEPVSVHNSHPLLPQQGLDPESQYALQQQPQSLVIPAPFPYEAKKVQQPQPQASQALQHSIYQLSASNHSPQYISGVESPVMYQPQAISQQHQQHSPSYIADSKLARRAIPRIPSINLASAKTSESGSLYTTDDTHSTHGSIYSNESSLKHNHSSSITSPSLMHSHPSLSTKVSMSSLPPPHPHLADAVQFLDKGYSKPGIHHYSPSPSLSSAQNLPSPQQVYQTLCPPDDQNYQGHGSMDDAEMQYLHAQAHAQVHAQTQHHVHHQQHQPAKKQFQPGISFDGYSDGYGTELEYSLTNSPASWEAKAMSPHPGKAYQNVYAAGTNNNSQFNASGPEYADNGDLEDVDVKYYKPLQGVIAPPAKEYSSSYRSEDSFGNPVQEMIRAQLAAQGQGPDSDQHAASGSDDSSIAPAANDSQEFYDYDYPDNGGDNSGSQDEVASYDSRDNTSNSIINHYQGPVASSSPDRNYVYHSVKSENMGSEPRSDDDSGDSGSYVDANSLHDVSREYARLFNRYAIPGDNDSSNGSDGHRGDRSGEDIRMSTSTESSPAEGLLAMSGAPLAAISAAAATDSVIIKTSPSHNVTAQMMLKDASRTWLEESIHASRAGGAVGGGASGRDIVQQQ